MLGKIIVFAVMMAVGSLLYSIGVMQILIILFCAMPLTGRLIKRGYAVNKSGLYKRFSVTIIAWIIISVGVSIPIFRSGNPYVKYGYLAGLGIAFLLSLGKWGRNEQNVANYFSAYSAFIPDARIQSRLTEDGPEWLDRTL